MNHPTHHLTRHLVHAPDPMWDPFRIPAHRGDPDTCEGCRTIAARMWVRIAYQGPFERVSRTLEKRFWWANTDTIFIDDELGEVLDGQFWGPEWFQKPFGHIVVWLDRFDKMWRDQSSRRFVRKGAVPHHRWKVDA